MVPPCLSSRRSLGRQGNPVPMEGQDKHEEEGWLYVRSELGTAQVNFRVLSEALQPTSKHAPPKLTRTHTGAPTWASPPTGTHKQGGETDSPLLWSQVASASTCKEGPASFCPTHQHHREHCTWLKNASVIFPVSAECLLGEGVRGVDSVMPLEGS